LVEIAGFTCDIPRNTGLFSMLLWPPTLTRAQEFEAVSLSGTAGKAQQAIKERGEGNWYFATKSHLAYH